MATIQLTIVTPEGMAYHAPADSVRVRTTQGDMAILPRHINYAAQLGNGTAKITADGKVRLAELSGGLFTVADGNVKILTNHFVWKDE